MFPRMAAFHGENGVCVCVPRTVNTIHRRGLIKSRLQRGRDAAPSSRPKKEVAATIAEG